MSRRGIRRPEDGSVLRPVSFRAPENLIMSEASTSRLQRRQTESLLLSRKSGRARRFAASMGQGFLFLVTSLSAIAVLFIFFFITRDAIPFFRLKGFAEFFMSISWYPSAADPRFGALPIFFGTGMVTIGAVVVSVPMGILAAICLSDILPFGLRQVAKPVIEILAAIPSVAYGFFALVVFAPLLQNHGGHLLSAAAWIAGLPVAILATVVIGDLAGVRFAGGIHARPRIWVMLVLGPAALWAVSRLARGLAGLEIASGANALNVSIILGIMALPTVVSVSEDALQSAGRELREGSYALGATRSETVIRTVLPAAAGGICAAVILGVMRAVGETMVVWMASGNAAQIPSPFFNYLQPVRTLTATIAGDMGEADHVTGSARYHVLFAMALCLLAVSFSMNLVSEWVVQRSKRKIGK